MSDARDARLANLLGALSTGLTDRVRDAAQTVAPLDGSTSTALIALLDFSPHGTVQTLSQICGLTHSGAVRLVNRLVDLGFVQRMEGRDARSIAISLTPSGDVLARQLRTVRAESILATFGSLDDRQRDDLVHACETLVSALVDQRLAQRADGQTPAGGALCRMCDFSACGRPEGRCPAAATAAAT